jgi:hypothetical protein
MTKLNKDYTVRHSAMLQLIATTLQTTIDRLPARVGGLKLGDTCGRCGGSGSYSFNMVDGSRCYGCAGSGQAWPRDLGALLTRARAVATDGRLAAYLAELAAREATKTAEKRLAAAWKDLEALNGYNKIWRKADAPENADITRRNDICHHASQRLAIAIHGHSITGRKGEKLDAIGIQRVLEEGLAAIAAVRAELEPSAQPASAA